jgi:hypothetical protein
MAPSAADIARLRRLVNEPADAVPYTDSALSEILARYPVVDAVGREPWVWSNTYPSVQEANPTWTEGWDFHSAASGKKRRVLPARTMTLPPRAMMATTGAARSMSSTWPKRATIAAVAR